MFSRARSIFCSGISQHNAVCTAANALLCIAFVLNREVMIFRVFWEMVEGVKSVTSQKSSFLS